MKRALPNLLACLAAAGCSAQASPLAASLPALPSVSALTPLGTFVTRKGPTLFDGDQIYRAIGANRPDLAAGPTAQACQRDGNIDALRRRQLATLFQMRKAGAQVARLWAFQSLAGPNGDDFSHIDSLLDVAHEVGIALILVLENHYPECSFGEDQRPESWYAGGFAQPYDGYRKSFEAYASDITRRYADEPAILMWQIVNEAQVPGHPEVVREFMTHMAQVIRVHDRVHLIAGGGAMVCDSPTGAADFTVMAQARGIDILDVHDFGEERVAWPGCLARAKEIADDQGLLLMVGESGVLGDPELPARRAHLMRRKMDAAAAQGVGIYLVWGFNTHQPEAKDPFEILAGDPVLDVLQQEATSNFAMRDLKSRALDPSDVVFLEGLPAWDDDD